jgi:hypothetical protein
LKEEVLTVGTAKNDDPFDAQMAFCQETLTEKSRVSQETFTKNPLLPYPQSPN